MVTVYRAKAKTFHPKAPMGGLLIEFTIVVEVNKLIASGLLWNSGFYEYEAYSGDSRPQQCFRC